LRIADHYTKEEDFRKHTIYIIKGFENHGPIEVARRYRDFAMLREVLLIRWPGCYIPPLPPKNIFNKLEAQFILERRAGLDAFLQKISDIFVLYHSQEFQLFLKFSGKDFISEVKPMKKVLYEEMVHRYATNFQHLSYIQTGDEAKILISRFKSFLGKMQGKFQTMRQLSKNAVQAKKAFYTGMGNFQTYVASVYEKEVIAEYEDHEDLAPIFTQENSEVMNQKAQKMRDAADNLSIEQVDSWLRAESRDLHSLMEAIQQMEKHESLKRKLEEKTRSYIERRSKLSTGEFNWKNFWTTQTKEAQTQMLEQKIEKTKNDVMNLGLLGNMIILVLAYDGIQKFKTNKSQKFYALMGITIQNELENLNSLTDYWTTLQKNHQARKADAPKLSNLVEQN